MYIKILSTVIHSFRWNLVDQMEVSNPRASQIMYPLLSAETKKHFQGTADQRYFKNLYWIKMHLHPSAPVSHHWLQKKIS